MLSKSFGSTSSSHLLKLDIIILVLMYHKLRVAIVKKQF